MTLDYFTLVEFRTLPDVPQATFSDAVVTLAAEYVQGIIEGTCGTSFVPRTIVETLDGAGGTTLRLKSPYVLTITSVTVNGVAVTDQFTFDAGVLERRTTGTFLAQRWTTGRRNIVVTYTAGYSTTPPADIKGAAMDATRMRLLSQSPTSTVDARRTGLNTDMGTISYVVAGEKRPTGYPEVDAVIMRWATKLNTVTYP